jgi:hypothetical protein
LDSKDFKGEGRVDLTHFQPHKLPPSLLPQLPYPLTDSDANLVFGFKFDGLKSLQAQFEGSALRFAFKRGTGPLVIKARSLRGQFHFDQEKIKVSFEELNLDYPQLNLAANLLLGRRSPQVSLELKGSEMDILSAREVALAFAGDVSHVQEIFGIVRGGKVPLFTLKVQGTSFADLGDLENILIKGNIVEGKIMVPEVELDLADVKGDAVISEGVLHGEKLEARLGNSWGREGNLRLALQGEDKAFHLDIGVQADLAELPPIMKRLVDDRSFQEEMSLIEGLKGNAVGRLVLGESTEKIKVRVDASELILSTKYKRIPYPLEIKGGHFSYDETRVAIKNLSGNLGKTSISELSASIDLEKELYLEVKSANIDYAVEEIYAWLTSIEGSPLRLEDIKSVKGYTRFPALELKGPLLSPEKWKLKTTYEPRNLIIDSTLFPGPIEITKGKFEGSVDPQKQKLSFRNVQVGMLDASMNISGATYDYFKGLNKIDATLNGVLGPESDRWVASLLRLPPILALRPPVSISDGRLLWEKDAKTSFKANVALSGGESVSIDVFVSPEEFRFKNVRIRDEVSDASAAFHVRKRQVGLKFQGHLQKTTFNRIFVESKFGHGWLKGDFRAHISLDEPMKSTAQGRLMGQDLILPYYLNIPLEIDKIALNAEKRHVDVEQVVLVSGDRKMDFKGDVDFSPAGLVFDMGLDTDGITWTEMEKLMGKDKGEKKDSEEKEVKQGKGLYDFPINGTLRLKSDYFNYDRFTWFPFNADITFDPDEINITIIQAELCGISTPGSLKITPKDVSLDFQPVANKRGLQTTAGCLRGEEVQITGEFDLGGNIRAQARPEKMLESLNGNFEIQTGKGRVHHHVPMEKLLAYLNVLGIVKGQLSEMKEKGFAFDSISAKAGIKDGKIVIHEGIIDGLTMDIASQGNVDLVDKKIDLVILVAPVKTVDTILQKIPIIRRITKDGLITVAVKMEGDLANPKVQTLPASAVGSGLVGMMKRTLKLPFEVIDPVLPKKGETEVAPQK